MATVANDIDRFLIANPAGAEPAPANRELLVLTSSPGGFKVPTTGAITPASITFDAVPLAMSGAVVAWSATGGTITTAGNRATLTSGNATDSVTVTATLTFEGVQYVRSATVQKVYDGAPGTPGNPGTPGTSPPKNAVAFLYKWSTSTPTKPANTSTFTWAGAKNTAYAGGDGWSIDPPANPGTPLIQLFVAQIAVTAPAADATTNVGYANSIVTAWAQNGATGNPGNPGSPGATGVQSGEAKVYQWAATIPAGPTGSPLFTWSNSSFGSAPTNWALVPGAAPSPGMTLWMASVKITDSAAIAQTSFNWTAASILAVGYAGTNGAPGDPGNPGAEGVSYVTAYCASATASTSTAPANTTGKTSVPAVNGGGITGTWSKTVPALVSGQFMYQSDGLYNPANNTVIWSIPYWSSLKVGTLSAITANLGAITGGSIDIGSGNTSWHVDSQGNMWIGAATFAGAPFRVSNTGAMVATNMTLRSGNVDMLTPAGLQPGFEAPGTKNSDIEISNLVRKSNFSDGAMGGWQGLAVEAISGENVSAVPYTKQLVTQSRDVLEADNILSVTPGETLYFSVWVNTEATAYGGRFGVVVMNSAGSAVFYATPCNLSARQGWAYLQGSFTVPSGIGAMTAAPWLQQDGSDFVALNRMRAVGMWIGRHARGATVGATWGVNVDGANKPANNATVGAPSGTPVGNSTADTVVSNAVAGKGASDALPSIKTDIAAKLSKAGADEITGQIGLKSQYALLVGNTNDGIFYGSTGIYGRKGGFTTFSIGADGTATFAGSLIAASGTLGSLTMAPGGVIKSSNAMGFGQWPQSGDIMYLSTEGFMLGNFFQNRYIQMNANGNIYMPGLTHENGQLTLTSPVIINPNFSTDLGVSMGVVRILNQPNATYSYFDKGVTITGTSAGPFQYRYVLQLVEGDITILGDPTASVVRLRARGNNSTCLGYLSVSVTDEKGATKTTSCQVQFQFGSGALY